MICLDSLRGRLVAAMLLVFALGLGGALALPPFEARITYRLFGRYSPFLMHDPYQDILLLIPIIVVALTLIWLVSAWSLRPLARASSEAAKAGPRNSAARIGSRGLPREIRPLVDAVNGALDRLADAYAVERGFTANAAHELRTPLAMLSLRLQRAKVEDAREKVAIECELSQMTRLVEQLLDLARKEHTGLGVPVPDLPIVNLSRIAREAAAATMPLVEAAARELEVELPDTFLVRGQTQDLRDAVRNLLDNALVHGQGRIRLLGRLVGAEHDAPLCVEIEVSDEGPGVPDGLQDLVFERFRKGRQDTSGSGLGLAIVREVAKSHNGSIDLLPGPGCRFRMTLMAALDVTCSSSSAGGLRSRIRSQSAHTASA